MVFATTVVRSGIGATNCRARKNGSYKKFEKAEKAIDGDGDGDELVLCYLTRDRRKEKNIEEKKVWFAENDKQPSEAGMMCTIDGNTFHLFNKNTWIGNSCASCHMTNNESGMYDVIKIDKSIQGSSGIMPTTKKGKLCMRVCQVNGQEQVHILWPEKFFNSDSDLSDDDLKNNNENIFDKDDANKIIKDATHLKISKI